MLCIINEEKSDFLFFVDRNSVQFIVLFTDSIIFPFFLLPLQAAAVAGIPGSHQAPLKSINESANSLRMIHRTLNHLFFSWTQCSRWYRC